jgi:uncharacterized repeat protein (TIGR04076 family)
LRVNAKATIMRWGTWTIESVTPEGMCLGAWGAVYPYVMALDLDREFSWKPEPSKIKIHCADPIGITLLVERLHKD